LAPIAAFPWNIAKALWLVVLLSSFGATVAALSLAAGFRRNDLSSLAFVAACLALAPFQTGISSGNPTILVVGLCSVAIWAAHTRRDVAAGVLFGMACGLKPQIGAFLVLYYLFRRRWHLFFTAVTTTIGLNLVAILYLWLRGASWLHGYVNNARGFVSANKIDDFSTLNPGRFNLINLQVPMFSITRHSSSANLLAFAVGGCLICAWLYWVLKGNQRESELLSLGTISIIGLLPVYHRFYDAALLAVPLCWCLTRIFGRPQKIAWVALLLMTPFLVPGAPLLKHLATRARISAAVAHSWWWDGVVMPHETWALLLLCMVLLYAIKPGLQGASHDEMAESTR
jgi:hypothetical protein